MYIILYYSLLVIFYTIECENIISYSLKYILEIRFLLEEITTFFNSIMKNIYYKDKFDFQMNFLYDKYKNCKL